MAKRKPWYEKHPFWVGGIFMAVYLAATVGMVFYSARGLNSDTRWMFAMFTGFGFLMSLPFVWTGVTRLANPKLKVNFTKYESSEGYTQSGEPVHVSRAVGGGTTTYSRPFALLSIAVGFFFCAGGLGISIWMGNGMRAMCETKPSSRCQP